MENTQRIIIVLGVYRSGTSALTKSLEAMGVRLPNSSQITFHSFNKKGDWEDQQFSSFNREALKALNLLESRYRSIVTLTEEEVNFLCNQGFLERASQLISKIILGSTPYGIKDPKFCILLPFWKKVFKECRIQVSFVIALRHPLNVVASIDAAQKILGEYHHEKSFWIWISYILTSLEQTEGCERILVDYDELVKDPAHQVKRITHTCRLKVEDAALQAYCDDFMDASLRHFHQAENHFLEDSFCRAFAIEMYETLLPLAKDASNVQELEGFLKKWRERFFAAHSLLVLVEKKEYEMEQLRQTIREREETILSLSQASNKQLNTMLTFYNTVYQQSLKMAAIYKH